MRCEPIHRGETATNGARGLLLRLAKSSRGSFDSLRSAMTDKIEVNFGDSILVLEEHPSAYGDQGPGEDAAQYDFGNHLCAGCAEEASY